MTLANNVAAKLSVAFVAVAMMFSLVAPAQAQNVEDMSLEELIALVNQLTGGSSSGDSMMSKAAVCPYTWTRSLSNGSTGADVMALQQFLNSMTETQVAVSGAGAPGSETSYYGPATAAAVSNFQMKYRAEILSPAGLVNPTGYFGPSTMAKANMKCASAPVMDNGGSTDDSSDDSTDDSSDDSSDDNRDLEGGAGSIEDADFVGGINNEDVGEGQDDVAVLGLEIEADKASDIMVTALKLDFDQSTGATADLDDYLTEVSVWFEGDKIAEFDVDEFEEDDDFDSTVSLGSDAPIIRSGDVGEITIAVSAISNLDSTEVGDEWNLTIQEVRFRDGDDAVITETSQGDIGAARSFTVEDFASAADIELKVQEEDDDINDSQTVEVDENDDTDNVAVLSFTIEAEGNSDLTIDDLPVDFVSTGAGVGEIINSVSLKVDGEELDSENVTASTSVTETVTFTDLDFVVDAGETVEVLVYVDINDIDGNFTAGDTLAADVNPDDAGWDVEDEAGDDVAASDKTGVASSEAHQFFADGLSITEGASDTATIKDTNGDTAGGEQGSYTIKFDVTAFGDKIFIPVGSTISTSSVDTDDGLAFAIENSDELQIPLNTLGTGSTTAAVSYSGDTNGGFYEVDEGKTETFTLTVTFSPESSGFFRAQMHGVNFNVGSATAADTLQLTTPAEDFETDFVDLIK